MKVKYNKKSYNYIILDTKKKGSLKAAFLIKIIRNPYLINITF